MSRPAHRQGPHRKGRNEQNSIDAYSRWMSGLNYSELARELGIDVTNARKRVLRGRAMVNGDVQEKCDRLSADLAEIMAEMKRQATPHNLVTEDGVEIPQAGDHNAAKAFTGLADRFSKLHGLDKPVRTDVTSSGEKITIQITPDWTGE